MAVAEVKGKGGSSTQVKLPLRHERAKLPEHSFLNGAQDLRMEA